MQIQLLHFLQQFKQKVRVRLKDKSHTTTSGFVSYPISGKLTKMGSLQNQIAISQMTVLENVGENRLLK